ncbi:E3 ubiquitin-protein ligase RAD18 [Brachionichthys hirsutus]|uniref:E3 ubiquitin-protein ligase RAD18 n=1 Tax=Brachionichthys hirsutus TaxID=412623 RepID=UPI00360518F6
MAAQIETDLPPSLECLNNVETLLRCPICFDFLNISMMTRCSHNFCSLCIRKFFSYKLQCPVCNMKATEKDLRNNRTLDELVVNFKDARKQLSKASFESPPISPKTQTSSVKCKTPRQMSQKCNSSVLSRYFQKKPKTSPTDEIQQDGSVAQSAHRGETLRSHNANEAELHSANAHLTVVVKEEPIDVEEASIQVLMSVKQEDSDSQSFSTEVARSSSPPEDKKPTIKVECPVCSVGVSQQFINNHLDMCLNSAEKKESLRSSLGVTRRPMGKLVYNLLSLQELRRRMKECHLSVKGSRDQLIKRHRDFVHTYNAQGDSLNPKSVEDIAREVEANEKSRNQLQREIKPVMVFSKNQTEEEIDKIHSNYRKQHSSDFSRLIAQVQSRLETTGHTRIKQEVTVDEDNAPAAPPADPETKSPIEDAEEPSTSIDVLPSPTHSDVSISSSISDIFGPEAPRNLEVTERTSAQKRKLSTRGDAAASSPVLGKRWRKS